MTAFAESVKLRNIDRSNLALTGKKQLEWPANNLANPLKPSQYEQKTAYHYRLLQNPTWMFEIARYDIYGKDSDSPDETNWGASMWNTTWDAVLNENSSLAIGESANWDPYLSTLFAGDPEAAVAEVLRMLENINDLLDEIKNERDKQPLPVNLLD